MNNAHAADAQQPGFGELLTRLLDATWYVTDADSSDAEIRRAVNVAALDRLLVLSANPDAQAQVRALAFDRVMELDGWLRRPMAQAGPDWRARYRFASGQIRRFLDDPAAMAPLDAPPGSPIG